MAGGVIGAEIFQEKIEKKVTEVWRCKRGRPEEYDMYLLVINNEYESHPQDSLINGGLNFDCPLGKAKGEKARADRREFVEGSVVIRKDGVTTGIDQRMTFTQLLKTIFVLGK